MSAPRINGRFPAVDGTTGRCWQWAWELLPHHPTYLPGDYVATLVKHRLFRATGTDYPTELIEELLWSAAKHHRIEAAADTSNILTWMYARPAAE